MCKQVSMRSFKSKGRKRAKKSVNEEEVRAMVVREIRSNAETKWFYSDLWQNFTAVRTRFYPLTAIPQGVGVQQRTGDRLTLKNLSFSISCENSNSTYQQYFFRTLIFQWFPSVAAAPAITEILYLDYWQSPLSMTSRQNYRVLYDKTTPVVSGGPMAIHQWNGTLSFNGPHAQIQYTPGTTTGTNQLWAVCMTSQLAANVASDVQAMVRFYDE